MQTESPSATVAPLMTEPDAARVLCVTPGFLRHDRMRQTPLVPFVRLGKAVRYSPTVIDAFIRKGGAA